MLMQKTIISRGSPDPASNPQRLAVNPASATASKLFPPLLPSLATPGPPLPTTDPVDQRLEA